MAYRDDRKIESIRAAYPKGAKVCLGQMIGEDHMPCGLKGEVAFVDDIGQIHVSWENGSSLALIPGQDQFHRIEVQVNEKDPSSSKTKKREDLSR